MMFGYATDETETLMPLALFLSRKMTMALRDARESGKLPFLRPDGKSQVTVEYDGRKPVSIPAVVLSTQHDEDIPLETLREKVLEEIIRPSLPSSLLTDSTRFYINPTGRFVLGGPAADTGLTGRKIIADTYDKGRQDCIPRAAQYREDNRSSRSRGGMRTAGGIRHRCRRACIPCRIHIWHRKDRRGQDHTLGQGSL